MKRCSEYRKLGAYDDAATCAATALSETGKPMLLARLLFSGEYDAHVKAVVDPALGINYPPASVMTMLLYQWLLSRVCQLIDEVELAVIERDALYEFCVKLIDRNLGFVNLLNTAAQIMHFMKHPIVAAQLIERAMAQRFDVEDWNVHLVIEASRRTRDELRPIVVDIVGKFSKVQEARAQFICASACQRIGKWDFAAQFWESKFELDPTDTRVLEWSRDCYRNAGCDDDAERIENKIVSIKGPDG